MSDSIKDNCTHIEKIAIGGQKKVSRANHKNWGEIVIKEGKTSGTTSRTRIEREIKVLSSLSSVYYPKQFFFEFKAINNVESEFIIVEEFINGSTLREVMSYFNSEDKIIKLLKELLEGLTLIWHNDDGKIVHRDLKPENIIIRPDKTPCILDLGIARLLEEFSLTPSIYPYGPCTPPYASPEQLRNDKDIIDSRSDFFSLGIIIGELTLGHHPFDSKHMGLNTSIPENILNDNHIDISSIDKLSKKSKILIKRLLSPKPYQRFRNMKSILNYLNN